MKLNRVVLIYGLYDPREPDHIRYIGKTIQPLSYRYKDHRDCIKKPKKHWNRKHYWIQSLVDEGIQFGIIQLFKTNEKHWENVERYLIWLYKELGHNITNKHKGGNTKHFYDDVNYDPISKEERYKRFIEGRIKAGGPDCFKRDEESILQGLKTRKENGNWFNVSSIEASAKRVATKRANGSYERNDEAIAKQLVTKQERGVNKPNKGTWGYGDKKITPEIVAKRQATKEQKLRDNPNYYKEIGAKCKATKEQNKLKGF